MECPSTLYVREGDCLRRLGDVSARPTAVGAPHHGIRDVIVTARVDGEPVQVTFRWNGVAFLDVAP